MRRAAVILAAVCALVLAAPAALADAPPPALQRAVATSLNAIEVQPNEPVDPQSVQPSDFVVQMASVNRPITTATVSPDGTRITLTSSHAWQPGEAGTMRLSAPGAIADRSGNVSLAPAEIHVGGAPGDFVAPVVTGLRVSPNKGVCFVIAPRCKSGRTAISFRSSEDGDTYATVFRGRRLIGERRFSAQPGDNYIRFDGKIGGRRLGPGLYTIYVAVQDEVGNRLPLNRQPHVTFRVVRR